MLQQRRAAQTPKTPKVRAYAGTPNSTRRFFSPVKFAGYEETKDDACQKLQHVHKEVKSIKHDMAILRTQFAQDSAKFNQDLQLAVLALNNTRQTKQVATITQTKQNWITWFHQFWRRYKWIYSLVQFILYVANFLRKHTSSIKLYAGIFMP